MMEREVAPLVLPVTIASKIDVSRLVREVETIDSVLEQAAIREPGTASEAKLPRTSRLMDQLIQVNKLNLLIPEERKRIVTFLRDVKAKAPVIHMSFSADPSPLFVKRLMTWLRDEIHPLLLVQIGLQPTMGAGCIVRTTNKYFDFSLKHHFDQQKDMLVNSLKAIAERKDEVSS